MVFKMLSFWLDWQKHFITFTCSFVFRNHFKVVLRGCCSSSAAAVWSCWWGLRGPSCFFLSPKQWRVWKVDSSLVSLLTWTRSPKSNQPMRGSILLPITSISWPETLHRDNILTFMKPWSLRETKKSDILVSLTSELFQWNNLRRENLSNCSQVTVSLGIAGLI